MNYMRYRLSLLVCIALLSTGIGCNDSTDTSSSTTVSSLTTLPDLGDLMSNSSTSSSNLSFVVDPSDVPIFSTIDDADGYFFGSLLDTDVTSVASGDDERDLYDDFYAGMAKCQFLSEASRTFAAIAKFNTTLCYMRGMPNGEFASGVEVSSSLFSPNTGDKLVKINLTNLPSDDEDDFSVFVKVIGSENTDSQYEFYLFECRGDAETPIGYQHVNVDSDGNFDMDVRSSSQSGEANTWVSQALLEAALTSDGEGGFVFDPESTKKITILDSFDGSFGSGSQTSDVSDSFNIGVVVDDGQMEMMSSLNNDVDDVFFNNKIYGLINFSGTGVPTLKFLEGAVAIESSEVDADNEVVWQPLDAEDSALIPSVGFEYDDSASPKYTTVTSSDTLTTVDTIKTQMTGEVTSTLDENFSFDYSTLTDPENDVETVATAQEVNCNSEANATVDFDLSVETNLAIANDCQPWVERSDICNEAWSFIDSMSTEFASGQTCPAGDDFNDGFNECWQKYELDIGSFTQTDSGFDEVVDLTENVGSLTFASKSSVKAAPVAIGGSGKPVLGTSYTGTTYAIATKMSNNTADNGSEAAGLAVSSGSAAYMAEWVGSSNSLEVTVSDGGVTQNTDAITDAATTYVCVVRNGTTLTSYSSTDGGTWSEVRQTTLTNADSENIFGLSFGANNTNGDFSVDFESFKVNTASTECPQF